MGKICPKCGTDAQEYHQFCPNSECEYDFPQDVDSSESNIDKNGQEKKKQKNFN